MALKTAKNICLIQPPASFQTHDCCLPTDYVGVGLLALSAYLEQHGFRTRIFHFPIALKTGRTPQRILQEIALFNPCLFAIGMNWVHFSSGALEVAEKLKSYFPDTPMVVGGQHASLFSHSILEHFPDLISAVIAGEAEVPLLRLCQASAAGESFPQDIPGVITHQNADSGADPEYIEDINSLPMQSFERVWPGYERPLAAVSTMRGGCPRQCAYCLEGSPHVKWKRRPAAHHSVEYIADQIGRFCVEGKTIITIQDQFSMRGDKAACDLAEAIRVKNIRLDEFNLFAEPGAYTRSGLDAIAAMASGRTTIDYGVETGSPSVTKQTGIQFKSQDFLEQIKDTTDAGVLPYTWWMVGLPGEGKFELEETRNYVIETMKRGAIPRWVTPLVLFPQTDMAVHASRYGAVPRFREFKHFLKFSLEPVNEYGCYPHLSTHDTSWMSAKEIAEAARALKLHIVDNWHLIDNFYGNHSMLRDKYGMRTKMLTAEQDPRFPLHSFF